MRLLLLILLLASCAPAQFHHTGKLTVEYHIVGDRVQFDWVEARTTNGYRGNQTVGAYAKNTDPCQIWLLGYKDKNGMIRFDAETLGHEIWECLRYQDPHISDPHR